MATQDEQEQPADWSAVAQALQDAENQEEDAPPFSVLSDGLLGGMTEKVPLEQSANLLLARELADGIRHDRIDLEEYLERIQQLVLLADNGVKLFALEAVRKETEKLPPEQAELVQAFESQIHVLKEGVELMVAYADTNNIDDLDRGLELVEQSLTESDRIQDRALELAAEIRAAEAEAAPQKAADEDAG